MLRRIFKRVIYKNVISNKRNQLLFGQFGLVTTSCNVLTKEQIESARNAINKKIKKIGKLWVCVRVKFPITKKPSQVRMGKGKGGVDKYIYYTKKNEVLFEIGGVSYEKALEAFIRGAVKLPCTTLVVRKN